MISLEKWMILAPLQKLPMNVEDLGKLIDAKGFKSCPKCKKSPTLVTLVLSRKCLTLANWMVYEGSGPNVLNDIIP